MSIKIFNKAFLLLVMLTGLVKAQEMNNPILKLSDDNFLYAADPAAEVFNGKVYVYCSRDLATATGYSTMQDYVVLESSDMVNWINHGVVLKPRTDAGFEYADGQMNAPDVAYKDGWYYYYFPYNKTYVGVAKSKDPVGLPTGDNPWETAVSTSIATIFDPTVFVDDDGQAYIYGNDHKVNFDEAGSHVYGAKLKDNMVELDGPWVRLTSETVNEAVHVFKRNGVYYFHGRVGSNTEYWTADSPLPAEYATHQGLLAGNSPNSPNHASVIEFNNQWYFFYHRGDVNRGSSVRRSACVDPMYFNDDGTIQEVVYSLGEVEDESEDGVIEAESFDSQTGGIQDEGSTIGFIKHNSTARYNDLNLLATNYEIKMRYSAKNTESIVRFETPEGAFLGALDLPITGGWNDWKVASVTLDFPAATKDVVIKFLHPAENSNQYICNVDWFKLTDTNSLGFSKVKETALFSIFPNPAQDYVEIYNNSSLYGGMVLISDMTGRLIRKTIIKEKKNTVNVDVSDLSKGNYILVVEVNGIRQKEVIIIE